MQIEYVLTKTDLSFDYGDFPGGTYHQYEYNGFRLDVGTNRNIDFTTLEPFGDCVEMMENIKNLRDLKRFLTKNFEFFDDKYKHGINELIFLINRNLKMEARK